MPYSVYQHWDPLRVCVVGRSYTPEFYKFITNSRVRTVLERIAEETEEDFQKLIKLLESFGVEVIRPQVSDDYEFYIPKTGNLSINKIDIPPMTPRDYSIMLGEEFYFKSFASQYRYGQVKGPDWPDYPTTKEEILALPNWVRDELGDWFNLLPCSRDEFTWKDLYQKVSQQGNNIICSDAAEHLRGINAAAYTRIGRDVYVGTEEYHQDKSKQINWLNENRNDYRWHKVDTGGHSDGTFCPVVPGLIVSLRDIPTYADTFPGWEVIYLPGQSWDRVKPFLDLKEKNRGKWWVPGEELNDDFTEFVESWLGHWVGYVEETVFDVNMLVIDEKNVVCNNYNKKVFETFDRFGITPHIVNFRHRYFWDGGLHCITSDLHREGAIKDYFPERG
jgi:hypothetical protein